MLLNVEDNGAMGPTLKYSQLLEILHCVQDDRVGLGPLSSKQGLCEGMRCRVLSDIEC